MFSILSIIARYYPSEAQRDLNPIYGASRGEVGAATAEVGISTIRRELVQKGGNMPGIHSESVILVEGDAGEFVPKEKSAARMHGFVVVVPPGDAGEQFLDLVWRFTMLYAAMPGWLSRRAKVAKMIEAVMSKESRDQKPARPPASESGLADHTQSHRLELPRPVVGSSPVPNTKSKRAVKSAKSQPALERQHKAKTRQKN